MVKSAPHASEKIIKTSIKMPSIESIPVLRIFQFLKMCLWHVYPAALGERYHSSPLLLAGYRTMKKDNTVIYSQIRRESIPL